MRQLAWMTERLAKFIIFKERKYKSVPENRRTDHLIFVTPWSKEWGVPHIHIYWSLIEDMRTNLSSISSFCNDLTVDLYNETLIKLSTIRL